MTLLSAARLLPEVRLEDGDVLIEQGEPGGRLFVLESGTVLVERDAIAVARIDTPGAVFGEMSMLLGAPSTATVRCQGPCALRVADDPEHFFAAHPQAALELARVCAGRVDALTRYLVDVKQQYSELDGHLGMLDTVLAALTHQQRPRARPGSVRDPDG